MIQFTKPLWLLLLIPLGYYTWRLTRKSLSDLSRLRSRISLGLRLALTVMLVFSLAGAQMIRGVQQQCVVFVIDVSDSIPKAKQDAALAYVNTALRSIRTDQKAGVVVFGAEASVEFAPEVINKIDKIESIPATSHTDISQAIGLALASFPEHCGKKIVLVSDGNETMGKSLEQAMLAGTDNVSIDVVPVSSGITEEALLDKMLCPANVKVGEPFDLKVVAVSKQQAAARIRLVRNGQPVGVKDVNLPRGKSVFTFQQSIAKPGGYEFQALLECGRDTKHENNLAVADTKVHGKPRVLYVEGQPGQAQYLADALGRRDMLVDVRGRESVPVTMGQLQGYDLIVFSDIPAWNLAPEQMEMIRSGVKDMGIGFTMVGGENSFGAGGYYDTPIEKTLPVDMSVRKTKVLPSLSVVIVIDKSGSMSMVEDGREKIQLADDAAASVVKLLQPIDKVSVVICHSWPVVAVKLQPARKKAAIYGEISTIRAEGGGIMCFPSLKMANDIMQKADTRQRHVIFLADGSDCDEQEGCVALAKKMASERITVTTVAIGDGPHVQFLKNMAAAGRGDFYLTLRARDLKAIFTKDVMTVSKALVVEEPFIPRMDTSSPELAGVDPSVPPLLGYVATGAKPAARVLAKSHKNDPILAVWQYGLGKSVAFTSDCKARWAQRWLGWPDYSRFWAQILRATMRKSPSKDFQTTVDISGGQGRVVVDAVDDKGSFLNFLNFQGSMVGPDMKSKPMVIEQTGPGRYEASFDARDVGSYVVSVARKDLNAAPEVSITNIPYSPEYKDVSPNLALLKRLASETKGVISPRAEDVFASNFRESRTYVDLWPLLVLLTAILLPVDVGVRRLSMSWLQLEENCAKVREMIREKRAELARRRATRKAGHATESVQTLLKTKKERSEELEQEAAVVRARLAEKVGAARKAGGDGAAKPETRPPAASVPGDGKAKKPVKPVEPPKADGDGDTASRLLDMKRRKKGD